MNLILQYSMITGHIEVYLFIYLFPAATTMNDYQLYHLLWIKLYVPLILKLCLYLVALEEDEGVQCILLYNSIILISVPNILNCMLHFL